MVQTPHNSNNSSNNCFYQKTPQAGARGLNESADFKFYRVSLFLMDPFFQIN